jgi:hypothetical protein
MKSVNIPAILLIPTLLCTSALSQEKGKGALEDFADDFGEEESGESSNTEAEEFLLRVLIDNAVHIVHLWGHTEATQFGPYPSYPYSHGSTFMASDNDYRSFFFNTEIGYNYLGDQLHSYLIKWETQFSHAHKLSFDMAFYEETLTTAENLRYRDRMTFYGFRYGYAVTRTPNVIMNLEGGFRGFHRNVSHGGPELALDLQVFPRKPLILQTEIAAALIDQSWLYTFESSAGVLIGRFEFLTGIRILKNKSADLLDGFRFGVRVWY